MAERKEPSYPKIEHFSKSSNRREPEPSGFELTVGKEDILQHIDIPHPFYIENNMLFKRIIKKADGFEQHEPPMVSRVAPIIIRELSNIERNNIYYEIVWKNRLQEKREIVPASTISTKRELMTLADSGFPVNDINYKDLISYFDKFLTHNNLVQSLMVERLGEIEGTFIHPLASQRIKVIPNDFGEMQLLEGFQTRGTFETWKTEVFERIKRHPKVLFMVLASFASVLLKDIKVSPFIVDLSGSTSQGKTTALHVASSVWGNKSLINEWNITKVALERKAGFLNSFPLYMDDTRKADERILQSIVYQFSGGRSKGRGSLNGSQREDTWNNVLLSTGEVSLSEYASKAGGAAARIIPLVDEPFEQVSYKLFSELYQAIEENHGDVGLKFIIEWQAQKETLCPEFYKIKEHYMEKAKGNEVLTRLSMYYAAVHFAGLVLCKTLDVIFDQKLLERLFDQIAKDNKTLDKPKELLEQILLELDSSRKNIYYDREPDFIKAVYKFHTICLTPTYLKEKLGAEEKMIRREWLKRGFIQISERDGKIVDYKQIKHYGTKYTVIVVNPQTIGEIGLDFSREKTNIRNSGYTY